MSWTRFSYVGIWKNNFGHSTTPRVFTNFMVIDNCIIIVILIILIVIIVIITGGGGGGGGVTAVNSC